MDIAPLHFQPDIQVALLESVRCIGSYVAHLAVEWELHAALLGHFVALLVGPLVTQSPLRTSIFGTVGEADGNDVSPLLKQERLFGGDGDCLFLALRNVCYFSQAFIFIVLMPLITSLMVLILSSVRAAVLLLRGQT